MTRWILLLGLSGMLLFAGARQRDTLRAQGRIAGHVIDTTVDHDIAHAYLAGTALPDQLAVERQIHLQEGTVPTREELAGIGRSYSSDVAALLFMETVAAQERNRLFQEQYAAAARSAARGHLSLPSAPPSLLVLFVPGWFYVENGSETGSDFLEPRRLFEAEGVDTRLVETDENGTVEKNAEIVAREIRAAAKRHRQVILVSASKSSAEVAQALGILPSEESSHVLAWLSIAGVLRGSPVADWAVGSLFCSIARVTLALDGFDMDGLLSMQSARQRTRFDSMRLPDHILYVSYVPVPLSGDVSDRGRFLYRATRDAGPGDGLTLLADELIPNALVLLEPGVDHFLDHPDQNHRTRALFAVVMNRLHSANSIAPSGP